MPNTDALIRRSDDIAAEMDGLIAYSRKYPGFEISIEYELERLRNMLAMFGRLPE